MSRAFPFSTGLLVGVCVFAWLAGPVLEARFGVEALLAVYASVSAGTAVTVTLDELEDLDVEREVRQLKAERSEKPDEE